MEAQLRDLVHDVVVVGGGAAEDVERAVDSRHAAANVVAAATESALTRSVLGARRHGV